MNSEQAIRDEIEHIYRKSYGALLVYAIRISDNMDIAKDAVQDAMLSLLKNPPYIEGELFRYILIAVKNKCISRLYHEERMKKREQIYSIDLDQFESFEYEFRGGRFLDFCLKNLTAQQSDVLKLQLVHEIPQKEIAGKLGITEKAVSQSKYFALKRIKQFIETGEFRDERVQKRPIFKK